MPPELAVRTDSIGFVGELAGANTRVPQLARKTCKDIARASGRLKRRGRTTCPNSPGPLSGYMLKTA